MIDWSQGEYERTAAALAPAARVAVVALDPRPGERVLDVACGTGNAAALAVEAGSAVTGVDSAERLLDVARARAPEATFVLGDAAALPLADASFDAAVSVFGVIFAAPGAATELVRVVRPGGRVVITAWLPQGPVFEASRLVRSAIALDSADAPAQTHWHDAATLERLFDRPLRIDDHTLTFTADSAESWWDQQVEHHPVWIAAGAAAATVRDAAVAVLRAASSTTDSLQITSRYLVVRVDI